MSFGEEGDPGMVFGEGEEESIIDAQKYYTIQYYYIIQLVLYLTKVDPARHPRRYWGVAFLLTYTGG